MKQAAQHSVMKRLAAMSLVAFTLVIPGCNGDDSTGPGGINFPAISDIVRNLYCVRGNATAGETKSGSIAASDCEDEGSYFESYQLKVASARTVELTLSSNFDGIMALIEVTEIRNDDIEFTVLQAVDDGLTGDDEELTATLDPAKNYAVVVGGWDTSDVGPYTLRIQ
jgi:hypothetical protein